MNPRAALAMLFAALLPCAAAHAQGGPGLFPAMLGDFEEGVAPPPPGEWVARMPRGYVHRALPQHSVRTLYVVPSNRTPQADAVEKMRFNILTAHAWYEDHMERHGFGPMSFNYETEADGATPKIHTLAAPNTDDWYRADPWSRVAQAAQAGGFPVWSPGQVWTILYEAHAMNPDGTFVGGFNGGASYGSGSDGGVGMTVALTMAYLEPPMLVDDRPFDGLVIPAAGPYPHKYDPARWYDGQTVSELSSVCHGIVIHETAHGFGLWHDFRNDLNASGNMMGNGFRGVRGWAHPDRYPGNDTRLSRGSALALSVSRYFRPDQGYTDNTKPSVTLQTAGAVAPVDGHLPVRFTASDAGGLACALLRVDGQTVGDAVLSGTSADHTFHTPWYDPGTNHDVAVTVFDAQGNVTTRNGSIVPSTPANRAPRPHFHFNPSRVKAGETITFNAGLSTDPDATPGARTVEWDLDGDGVYETAPSTQMQRTWSYATPGIRQVRMRLTDGGGAVSESMPVGIRVTPADSGVEGWWGY